MSLKKYIEQQNQFRRILKKEEWTLPMYALVIHGSLEAALSPENLTCDGELRGAQLMAKARFLNKAMDELKRDYSVYVETEEY